MSEVVSDLLFTWKFGVMGAWETVLVKSFGIVIVPYVLNSISSLAGCCGGCVKGLTEVHIGDISLPLSTDVVPPSLKATGFVRQTCMW